MQRSRGHLRRGQARIREDDSADMRKIITDVLIIIATYGVSRYIDSLHQSSPAFWLIVGLVAISLIVLNHKWDVVKAWAIRRKPWRSVVAMVLLGGVFLIGRYTGVGDEILPARSEPSVDPATIEQAVAATKAEMQVTIDAKDAELDRERASRGLVEALLEKQMGEGPAQAAIAAATPAVPRGAAHLLTRAGVTPERHAAFMEGVRREYKLQAISGRDVGKPLSAMVIGRYFFAHAGHLEAHQDFHSRAKDILTFEDGTVELHKREADGETYLVGFIDEGEASRVAELDGIGVKTFEVNPKPDDERTTVIFVPGQRIDRTAIRPARQNVLILTVR
jgi:hypothetical protein